MAKTASKPRKKADTVDELLEDDALENEAEDTEEEDLLDPDVPPSGGSVVDDDLDEESLTLDLDEVDEEAATFKPLPAGTYECFIEQMEVKKSSNGNPMASARYKVAEGEYENRLLFDNFVLNNEFGQARLKKMLMQLGFWSEGKFNIKQFVESGEAVGTPLRVQVRVKFDKNYGKQNQIVEITPSAQDDPFHD